MYRQILIDPSQTSLQRILWRDDFKDDVDTYELTIVTYGTSSASYLATRCLVHLADQHSPQYPVGSARVKRDFYVDDLLTGADTLAEARSIRNEIIQLLRLGAFKLSKWASNCPELLDITDSRDKELVTIDNDANSRVLGIQWSQSKDMFRFSYDTTGTHDVISKRTIISEVSRLFDPLGLLGPIIVIAKLVLQELWRSSIHWDESVPQDIHTRWTRLKSQLVTLNQLQIPRHVKFSSNARDVQIHGFCDANSTITLNWITFLNRKWSVFVANKVGEIHRLTEICNWHHVASSDNSADILSRGSSPQELVHDTMWWHGPPFLQFCENRWPRSSFASLGDDVPEQRMIITTIATLSECVVSDLLGRCSSLTKVCRIVAYCFRFSKKHRTKAYTEFVSPTEISFATDVVCRAVQRRAFPAEYKALSEGRAISTTSRLLSLSPFIDCFGLIRVGGRLKNLSLPFDARHPVLLPARHNLTRRVIEYEHIRNLHAGVQATMAAIRQRFWPLSLRSSTRKIVQGCVICFKVKPRTSETIMGPLPTSRVTVSRPFSHCGVDYAGPVILREGKRRNAKNHKAYISIFVCFSTKAIHIELVSDLTTDTFLTAFKRFISQRDKPSHMYSDNGTTFVGAQNQLKELYEFYNKVQTQSEIRQSLCNQQISWSFIPPHAPHFGGLWEAGVKSAKYHMARIIGKAHLTFEELQTVLCEIEAILNSRPITSLSADSDDLSYLTPGHFLVGAALNSFPCTDVSDINENRLLRWQTVEQVRQHFWRRWSNEYLHSLQERSKWKISKGIQLQPNQVVLVKLQNLAPLQWSIERVQVHPGENNIVRTAIKTSKGAFVRPLSKLAILPVD
nr:PREDICTED: uncharacterized protein LOC105677297 [Linepithema humile]